LIEPENVGFGGAFVAGMRDRNAELMQDALDRLFVDSAEKDLEEEALGGLGLPVRRQALRNLIANMRSLAEVRARLREAVGAIALDDPMVLDRR
jgi:hypothetical protein